MKTETTQVETFNCNLEFQAEPTALVELGELQLALVGGGTGDVVLP